MSTIPDNFDQNLAYFVRCRFAEEFVNSKKNFDENRQLFDILYDHSIENNFATYLVNENFPLKKELKRTIQALDEAGIISYWTEHIVREAFPKHVSSDAEEFVQLKAMVNPLSMIVAAMIAGLVILIIEIVHHKWTMRRSTRVTDLRMERLKRQKGTAVGSTKFVRIWRSYSI